MRAKQLARAAIYTAGLTTAVACAPDDGSDSMWDEAAAIVADEESPALAAAVEPAPVARPVLVVAGLMQDANTVAPLAEGLRRHGHDVTIWVPANFGLDDIRDYAKQLGATLDEVRERSGAAQVDLVGHSEGGLTARQYVKSAGANAHVHTLIALGSPQQGTEGGLLSQILRLTGCELWAPACKQMVAGSEFLKELNGGDPTPGNVRYVSVGTRQDGVVQPVTRAAIPGGENVVMQEACRYRRVGHFGLLEDGWVHQLVLAVLAGNRPNADCRARPLGGLL